MLHRQSLSTLQSFDKLPSMRWLYDVWSYSPTYQVVVFPAVAQLQDKLLPNVGNSPQSTMVVVDQT